MASRLQHYNKLLEIIKLNVVTKLLIKQHSSHSDTFQEFYNFSRRRSRAILNELSGRYVQNKRGRQKLLDKVICLKPKEKQLHGILNSRFTLKILRIPTFQSINQLSSRLEVKYNKNTISTFWNLVRLPSSVSLLTTELSGSCGTGIIHLYILHKNRIYICSIILSAILYVATIVPYNAAFFK